MEETTNKKVRGPRIYMGAPAEVVAQLKTIARKRNTHVSVLLRCKAYDLIEEYEHFLKDEPLAVVSHEHLDEYAEEQVIEAPEAHTAPAMQTSVWEPLGDVEEKADVTNNDEEVESAQAHAYDEQREGVHIEQHVESDNALQQQKGIFEGVRALWKKNSM